MFAFILSLAIPGPALGPLSYMQHRVALLHLTHSMSTTGRGVTFTINCSGFGQHGADPTALNSMFNRKPFRPATNISVPTQVNISFTMSAILDVVWDNPFISWNPEECEGITKMSMAAKNLWLPDIFIIELCVSRAGQREVPPPGSHRDHSLPLGPLMDVDKTPKDLTAYVSNEGRIRYKKPMKVDSICNLDIFYFPFDQQNCTLTFSSFLYTVDSMLLDMEKEVWEITDASRNILQTHGEWELLGISKATAKLSRGGNLYDQIVFYVAIRRRPSLYVINLLVPSGFLVTIDALSFYLPVKSGNRVPFKITLLLGYNVFLLMMSDLLPTCGTPLIGVYFALCLSLMVGSLLETIFITHLLHVATTQPPPLPRWLHCLLLHCTSPGRCCPTAPQKGNKGLGLTPTHLPGVKEPEVSAGQMPGPGEAELTGGSEWTRAQREHEAQKQHSVELWVQFSHVMDTLLFRLYLLFMASSIVTIICLWNT
ncbi:5-hydroxytryptamine receptor 3E isoform X3 [Hylobates moloch]|uniref:5-hydroxytryptamine receptor 3E isoform X3 n=1 Tax=Hylobates moloch TaxID=81572 RepID=UPI0013632A59|nr:5-hydroxytryptamine receptor 3E isoform X3 [Hylobates moloch]